MNLTGKRSKTTAGGGDHAGGSEGERVKNNVRSFNEDLISMNKGNVALGGISKILGRLKSSSSWILGTKASADAQIMGGRVGDVCLWKARVIEKIGAAFALSERRNPVGEDKATDRIQKFALTPFLNTELRSRSPEFIFLEI